MAEAKTREALEAALDAAATEGRISQGAYQRILRWLREPEFERYRPLLVQHIQNGDFELLDDLFWTVIPFGTGGRRGRMYPIGTNAINERTIGESAQGLADYLRSVYGQGATLTAVVAYDTRQNSREFAQYTACVLAANGIRTFLFEGPRPTPELSFAVRYLGATTGVVISASHNPPSDNGFKCYWGNGAQVIPPHDRGILECVQAVQSVREVSLDQALNNGVVQFLDESVDQGYVAAVVAESVSDAREARIAYSPLHGTGYQSVLPVLFAAGFKDLHVVDSQRVPDGRFPAVPNNIPNPETRTAMEAVINLAAETNSDVALASDPDADRIGVAVPTPQGWTQLTGNQVAAILTYHVLSAMHKRGALNNAYIVKTYVTTEMMRAIADHFGVRTIGDLPVGFKWIADTVEREDGQFLFAAEESLGYLKGHYCRDKDGAVGALLVAECVAELRRQGKSMWDHLQELYCRFGYFHEEAYSEVLEGRKGAENMQRLMRSLRTAPPEVLGGLRVGRLWDFKEHTVRELGTGKVSSVERPDADMVTLELDRPGWRIVGRPSGTEPKIKFYLSAYVPPGEISGTGALAEVRRRCAGLVGQVRDELRRYVRQVIAEGGG